MHSDFVQLLGHYSSSSTVHVANADCESGHKIPSSGKDLCNYYNLPHYPYLVYGTNGNITGEYRGDRTYKSMKSFIDSQPALSPTPAPIPEPTPVPTPTPSGACSFQHDRGTADKNPIEVKECGSVDECCSRCTSNAECAHFTLTPPT